MSPKFVSVCWSDLFGITEYTCLLNFMVFFGIGYEIK